MTTDQIISHMQMHIADAKKNGVAEPRFVVLVGTHGMCVLDNLTPPLTIQEVVASFHKILS